MDYFCTFDISALFIAGQKCLYSSLVRVILPHDHVGCHLDSHGNTAGNMLKLENSELARKVVATMWSQTVIDNLPVVVEYIAPLDDHGPLINKNAQ